MVSESTVLKALDNFFEQDTFIFFFVTIFFLVTNSILHARVKQFGLNMWLTTFLSSWFASIITFSSYYTVKYLADYIHGLRFSVQPHLLGKEGTDFLFVILVFSGYSTLIATLFLIYAWIKRILARDMQKVQLRFAMESAAVYFLISIYYALASLILGGWENLSISDALATIFPVALSIALAFLLYNYSSYINQFKIREKELQIVRLREQVAQSKLDELSSKINPHFLYNSLNSIAGLSMEDGSKAREMAIALSKLFRYNINRDESSYASIREEVEMVLLYLQIEKIRFEERLQYSCTIQHGLEECLIPKHILQPLVENAVKHGMSNEGVMVDLVIKKDKDSLIFSVRDTGSEFDPDFNPGYGLISLYEKLDILAKDKYKISFLNDPKSVQVEIQNFDISV